jgi:hypothetical protein
MLPCPSVSRYLRNEARALLTRLAKVRPFALSMPMVPAATVSVSAQAAIEQYMLNECRRMSGMVHEFLRWLSSPQGLRTKPDLAQRRYCLLRLRFQAVLTQFHIFADVLNQRSEHDTGVWLSGLDAVAADALEIPGGFYECPPVICYLDRGIGAAIRRARTRLPGGGKNPVAIVRIPRERMIGSGIASSLVHEVGHQGSALLDLVNSIRPLLQGLQRVIGPWQAAWSVWERWISEVLADFWSVARIGIASTLGLMGVVSLPRAFVFRPNLDDPHPSPWIRVRLSCAMGQALYPHPQWGTLVRLWESLYPSTGMRVERKNLFTALDATIPGLVVLIMNHRPPTLRGKSLQEVMAVKERQPGLLANYHRLWRKSPELIKTAPPSLVFAVVGQAVVDGAMSPEEESRLLDNMLRYWALRSTLDASVICSELRKPSAKALVA